MKNNDAELIQRVLKGDDNAFAALVRKYQKQVHAARVAENWRFPHCRGDYTRHIPESIQETRNTEKTPTFRELALCPLLQIAVPLGYVKSG